MQVRSQEEQAPLLATVETTIAPKRRSVKALTVTAGVVCGAVLILAITFSLRAGSPSRSTTQPVPPAPAGVAGSILPSTRLQAALGWVHGLAAGLILPSDVTSRLEVQDPKMAKIVMSAWADLTSVGGSSPLRTAMGWIEGLSVGLIDPSDVTRLAVQSPRMGRLAQVIMAGWSELGTVQA